MERKILSRVFAVLTLLSLVALATCAERQSAQPIVSTVSESDQSIYILNFSAAAEKFKVLDTEMQNKIAFLDNIVSLEDWSSEKEKALALLKKGGKLIDQGKNETNYDRLAQITSILHTIGMQNVFDRIEALYQNQKGGND